MEAAPTGLGHVPPCQETNAVLLERHDRRMYLSHDCKHYPHVFCQACSNPRDLCPRRLTVLTPPSLLPAVAYTLDMYRRTGEFYGINESLFSSALAAVVFISLLSAQPLTMVGVTGLVSLFNFTIYDILQHYDGSIYPAFMAWL